MSQVRFIADLHFGHRWMSEHRGFPDVFTHDEFIVNQWNSVVNKKDVTYILGDITMASMDHYYRLDALKGRKIVILGNHDDPAHVPELLKYVDKVAGMVSYKGIWITHCPVHPMEMAYRVKKNIHGHIHEKIVMLDGVPDDRYYCVSGEHVDYKPQTLIQLGIRV